MFAFLKAIESSVYVQIGTFVILVPIYFFSQRRLPSRMTFGISMVRLAILVLIFSYLTLTWSSEVNPSLRSGSVLGMFILNLFFLWQIIVARKEIPYRQALEAATQEPFQASNFHQVVQLGKRYYYYRHFWHGLLSGLSPSRFLHAIASEQIRHDVKNSLSAHGMEKNLITFPMEMAFLRKQLADDETLPAEFKEVMGKVIDEFANHPWVEEHVNRFLSLVMENPGDLLSPEFTSELEKSSQ